MDDLDKIEMIISDIDEMVDNLITKEDLANFNTAINDSWNKSAKKLEIALASLLVVQIISALLLILYKMK